MRRWRARTVAARKAADAAPSASPGGAPARRGVAGLADASIALAVRDEEENGELLSLPFPQLHELFRPPPSTAAAAAALPRLRRRRGAARRGDEDDDEDVRQVLEAKSHAGRVRRFYQRRRSSQLDLLEWTVETRRRDSSLASGTASGRPSEAEDEEVGDGEVGDGGVDDGEAIVTRRRVVTDPSFFWEGLTEEELGREEKDVVVGAVVEGEAPVPEAEEPPRHASANGAKGGRAATPTPFALPAVADLPPPPSPPPLPQEEAVQAEAGSAAAAREQWVWPASKERPSVALLREQGAAQRVAWPPPRASDAVAAADASPGRASVAALRGGGGVARLVRRFEEQSLEQAAPGKGKGKVRRSRRGSARRRGSSSASSSSAAGDAPAAAPAAARPTRPSPLGPGAASATQSGQTGSTSPQDKDKGKGKAKGKGKGKGKGKAKAKRRRRRGRGKGKGKSAD